MVYFIRGARDLGPRFHCGGGVTCSRREKDLAARPFQCPTCDLSYKYQYALRCVRLFVWERFHNVAPGGAGGELADLAKLPWPFPEWPLDRVVQVYNYVTGELADSDGRILDSWDALTAKLARIIVEERNQADFADHCNQMAQLKSQSQSGGITTITRR